MKKFCFAATVLAVSATFAMPSFAMDNPVNKSRAKIEKALGQHDAYAPKEQTRATTYTVNKPEKLDRYERAHQRLFGSRSGPSGR